MLRVEPLEPDLVGDRDRFCDGNVLVVALTGNGGESKFEFVDGLILRGQDVEPGGGGLLGGLDGVWEGLGGGFEGIFLFLNWALSAFVSSLFLENCQLWLDASSFFNSSTMLPIDLDVRNSEGCGGSGRRGRGGVLGASER